MVFWKWSVYIILIFFCKQLTSTNWNYNNVFIIVIIYFIIYVNFYFFEV